MSENINNNNTCAYSNMYNTCFVEFVKTLKSGSLSNILDARIVAVPENDKKIFKVRLIKGLPQDKIVAKMGKLELLEIELLKKITHLNLQSMIELVGYQDDFFTNTFNFLIFPKAMCDLQDADNMIDFTPSNYKKFEKWCIDVLGDLAKLNYAYLDWKPSNILIFENGNDLVFKLADFGSVQELDKKTKNKCNINILFSSPFVSQCYDEIVPSVLDDEIGLVYIYIWLKKNTLLPWIFLTPTDFDKGTLELNFFVLQLKTKKNLHYINTQDLEMPEWMEKTLEKVYNLYDF